MQRQNALVELLVVGELSITRFLYGSLACSRCRLRQHSLLGWRSGFRTSPKVTSQITRAGMRSMNRDRPQKKRLLTRWRDRKLELEREAEDARAEITGEESERKRQASQRDRLQRAETKRLLADWKDKRAAEDELSAERQRRDDGAKARHEREKQRQHLQQRDLVEFHRRRREAARQAREEEEKASHAATAKMRHLSQDDKQRIAKRSMEVLRRKLQAQGGSTPRAATRSPSPLASRHRAAMEHVESRLYDTTESFIGKIKGQPPLNEDSELLATTETSWKGHLRTSRSLPPRFAEPERAW